MSELPKAVVIVLSARCPRAVVSLGSGGAEGPVNKDLGIRKAVVCEHRKLGVCHTNMTGFSVQTRVSL